MEKNIESYDVIIIGGGAAGLTSAIYCGRAKLNTLVIEQTLIGGLATYSHQIKNYPGFPDGITGAELMNKFYKQAKNLGVKFKFTRVDSVDFSNHVKRICTTKIDYVSPVIIIAGGGKPRFTGAKGEDKFLYDKGISFCATCDAASNQDKTVLVIGGGESAIQEARFLAKFAQKVIVCVRHDQTAMRCSRSTMDKALTEPNIAFVFDSVVDSFYGDSQLEYVRLKNNNTNQYLDINVDTCFLFIGYSPNTEIVKGSLLMSKKGYLITNEKMETNIKGVFAAGDIREKYLKQIATAINDGAIAAYSAEKYLVER